MCLLITQSQDSPKLSDAWLEDFYDYNSDGVGVMYVRGSDLVIEKVLPKNAHQFVAFYREHIEGRACAYHLRMRTHGAIDLDNCHPYEVLNQREHGLDLWLMHNGVLSTGNAADTSKSDTWHYIRDYLRPMLTSNPDYAFTQSFSDIVGTHIGASNKFVLMDNSGRLACVNQSSGYYWAGLWLSNTYAWSASKSASKTPIKGYKKQLKQAKEKPQARVYPKWNSRTPLGYWDGYDEGDEDDSYGGYYDDFDEVEILLSDIADNGYSKAASVSVSACMDFVEQFGIESFSEVAFMLLDGNIGEDWFIKTITDEIAAREAFPFLARRDKYDDYGVNTINSFNTRKK
jgi:predicted glutamine amidotransferase